MLKNVVIWGKFLLLNFGLKLYVVFTCTVYYLSHRHWNQLSGWLCQQYWVCLSHLKFIAHKVKNQIPLVSYIGSWTILAFWFLVSSNKCFMLSLCLWKGMILSLSNEKDFSSFGSSFSRLPASNKLLFLNPYIGSYCTPHFRIVNFYSFCSYLVFAY